MSLTPSTLTALQSMVDGYAQALANDALNPGTDYSLDGQTVNRNQWRAGLLKMITDTNQLINSLQPYQIVTKQVL